MGNGLSGGGGSRGVARGGGGGVARGGSGWVGEGGYRQLHPPPSRPDFL